MPSLLKNGIRLMPSYGRSFGMTAPDRKAKVGKKSSTDPTSMQTRPEGSRPGHHATAGSRIPPSHVSPLAPRRWPGLPPSRFFVIQGPLSLVKKTSVFESSLRRLSVSSICPTLQSISSMTSPKSPRREVSLNFSEAKMGTWGMV